MYLNASFSDLYMAAKGQWPGGCGVHWHTGLHPSTAEHQESDPCSRCLQVHHAAALPGGVPHSLLGQSRLQVCIMRFACKA